MNAIAKPTPEQQRVLNRLSAARDDARRHGAPEPSAYFLDKCTSEAGFFDQDAGEREQTRLELQEGKQLVNSASPWRALFGDSWIGRLIWRRRR